MSEKPKPLTVDPETDAFRRMTKGTPPLVGENTKNRVVVEPFGEDGYSSDAPPTKSKTPEPLGGYGEETRRKTAHFYEEGLAESERLQKRKRR